MTPTCVSEGFTVVRMSVGRSTLDTGGGASLGVPSLGGASLGVSSWSESESESRSLFINARPSISLWGGQDRTV